MNQRMMPKSEDEIKKGLGKVSVGIIIYNGEVYFERLFKSLLEQTYANMEIFVLDNGSQKDDSKIIKKNYGKKVKVIRSEKNLGFGKAHNFLINKTKGDYYLCLNQDMFLDKRFVEKMVQAIESKSHYGSVSGKLFSWDFEWDKKLDLIDTVGIQPYATHKFEDLGQGQKDAFTKKEERFGASGAAALYKRQALESVAFGKEYFDELFFMYGEDVDLAYRLQWAGWKCVFTPQAKAWHDRTVSKKKNIWQTRFAKSLKIRRWSYLNSCILLKKNFTCDFSWRVRFKTFLARSAMSLWVQVLERNVWKWTKKELARLDKKIQERKLAIAKVVPASEIEKFFI